MNLFAISDIHGRYNEFIKLLKYAGYDSKEDYLINLGDMIDRGPDSYKVVEWFRVMNASTDGKVQSLFGNHEHLYISFSTGHVPEKDYFNKFIGGKKTIESYTGKSDEDIMAHMSFISSLPLYLELGDYVFVHGGLNVNKPLHEQSVHDTAWDYGELYKQNLSNYDKIVVYGHTPTIYIYEHYKQKGYEIWRGDNQICIDCTFSKSRKLLLYDLINDIEYYYDFARKECYTVKN